MQWKECKIRILINYLVNDTVGYTKTRIPFVNSTLSQTPRITEKHFYSWVKIRTRKKVNGNIRRAKIKTVRFAVGWQFLTGPKHELMSTAGNCIWLLLKKCCCCSLQTGWMESSLQAWRIKINISLCKMCFHCCICKFETIISTAWQGVLLFFHPLAGSLLLCFLFLGCSAFENNCWSWMTETKITISFPHQSIEPWTFFLPYAFDPWNRKSNTK